MAELYVVGAELPRCTIEGKPVSKVRPGKRLEKPNVNVRRRAIRETARLNRITPKRLAKHMKRHPDAPISRAIGALL